MQDTPAVVVCGSFDDLRLPQIKFLDAASQVGRVKVYLWSDDVIETITGAKALFPLEERSYLLQALRFVHAIEVVEQAPDPDRLPGWVENDTVWFMHQEEDSERKQYFCSQNGIGYRVYDKGKPFRPQVYSEPVLKNRNRKVMVTGSFDWLHSGHIRFFEECSRLGDLYVIVGHDENIRLLKGAGHPMFPQEERLYMVQAVRYVKRALISTGHGWMDAAPEVELIQPDIYAVNQDGDVPEKRSFCEERGIEYRVQRRLPKPGLPERQSTLLRQRLEGDHKC